MATRPASILANVQSNSHHVWCAEIQIAKVTTLPISMIPMLSSLIGSLSKCLLCISAISKKLTHLGPLFQSSVFPLSIFSHIYKIVFCYHHSTLLLTVANSNNVINCLSWLKKIFEEAFNWHCSECSVCSSLQYHHAQVFPTNPNNIHPNIKNVLQGGLALASAI